MRIHRSKIDFWLALLIGGCMILPIVLAWVLGGPILLAAAICGATTLFMVWLYLATRYVVTNDKITIHAGLYKVIIPINSITSVTPSYNPLASPAFSLDRLEISYRENSKILISPKDKQAFLSDLGL